MIDHTKLSMNPLSPVIIPNNTKWKNQTVKVISLEDFVVKQTKLKTKPNKNKTNKKVPNKKKPSPNKLPTL